MKCQTAKRWLSRSIDRPVERAVTDALEAHLAGCARCRAAAADYKALRARLADSVAPEPLPNFWGRLEARLDVHPAPSPQAFWLRWSLRAIPVSLAMLAGFLAAAFIFLPPQGEMNSPEAMLFSDENPIAETRVILEDDTPGNREIAILFAADERIPVRKN